VADLKLLLERLLDAEIEFVIVGGFAAVLHGSTLVTRDLDVCTLLTDLNVEKLRGILVDLAPVHRSAGGRLSFLTNPDPGVPVKNLYLETNAGALDLLGSITGVGGFERVRERAIDVELFGRRCMVMSLSDLIAAKRAMGRDRDQLAVRELEAIAEKGKK
jgi:predicted nucleotidyltransferase